MARRTIPLIIAFLVGWVIIISTFMPTIESWGEDAAIWFDILAAIAFLLGGGNLIKVHSRKVKKQASGWGYSMVTLVFFLATLLCGLFKIGGIPSKKYPFGLEVSHSQNPIVWLIESERVHIAALGDGESIVIGSGDEAQLEISGDGVATTHCRITRKGDGYVLSDLGSETGTSLHGKAVTGPTPIRHLDRFRVGTVGDPVVSFRTGATILHQVTRPDGGAPITIHSGHEATIHVMGAAAGNDRHEMVLQGNAVWLDSEPPPNEEGDEDFSPQERGALAAGAVFGVGELKMLFRPSSRLTGEYSERGESWFWYFYQYGFRPLVQATFAMLAFYVASAAFRAFRAKNVDAIILLSTAFVILLGRTYLGTLATSWVPQKYEAFTIPNFTIWIMQVINAAGNRAIMIGIALGIASTSLKVILGIDRSYLGGEGD